MTVITKLIVEQAARSITSFMSNITPETKKGNHPILLTGGVEVEVELKAGLENKLVLIAKVGNCIVYRDKVTYEQLWDIKNNAEALYGALLFRTLEALYDNALIADFSLMKLISAVSNQKVSETKLELPAGFTVELKKDGVFILNADKKHIELQEFKNNDYPLSPALCIPKTIVTYMVVENFKPFVI